MEKKYKRCWRYLWVKYNKLLSKCVIKAKQKLPSLKKQTLPQKRKNEHIYMINPTLKFYINLYDKDSAMQNVNGIEVLRGRNW